MRLLLLPALLLTAMPLAAQRAASATPDSATIAAGKLLFEGRGICFTCHGMQGEGMLGPTTVLNANKPKWLHHDGTLKAIIALIKSGVDADHSVSGQVMAPGGGGRLTDAQIAQVAAYVMVLHRQRPTAP